MWDLIVSVPDHRLSFYFGKLAADENSFRPNYFDPDRRPPDFIGYFNTLRLDLHSM